MSRASRAYARIVQAQPNIDKDGILAAVAIYRALSTQDGQVLLAWLKELASEVMPSNASDSALRMKEGKRQLVAEIENQFKRGERESRPGSG